MDRRTSLALSTGIAAAAALGVAPSATAQKSGGVKLTVLYGAPKNPDEFDRHYLQIHMPLVAASPGIGRYETSKGLPASDGSAPPYYRIFEAWFDSAEQFAAVTGTPAWAKVRADLANFATGGATRLVSKLD